MGYPMTYPRVVMRNGLQGDYSDSGPGPQFSRTLLAGDMRRLEEDQRDARHIARYAEYAGVSKPKAAKVLEAFFTDFMLYGKPPEWLAAPCWPEQPPKAA